MKIERNTKGNPIFLCFPCPNVLFTSDWNRMDVSPIGHDFTRLQELFRFNGIPHYETITPEGEPEMKKQ